MPAKAIPAAEVAKKLSCNETTFRNKRRKLEVEHGFPPKLPGFNAWSEPAVDRWITTNGHTYLPGLPGSQDRAGTLQIVTDAAESLAREFGHGTKEHAA
ncbi:hypothetical protein FMN63_24970 [Stappia sp. BW2]|uniref:hypothetical protein n=1 Tax=Stappia sp. BW2 TaxID=2592622 RepID=UPI0011DECE19|nr:hypothetical protein [Stappia sp. BW2]TYC65638.1 hypothetical protein FMN63_24970 [Stappia sp. BW2]